MKVVRILILVVVVVALVSVWYSRHTVHRPGTIEGSGTIEATQVDLAPKVSGRVVKLTVIEGDIVKTGGVIAELDGTELREQLQEAEASFHEAQAKVREAQANLTLEERQYSATLEQAQAAARSDVPRVPQASESTRLQEGTVQAQIRLVEAQVSSSQAAMAAANGNAQASQHTYEAAQDNLRTAQANLDHAKDDDDRYELLFHQDAVSAQQRDQARTSMQAARGQRDAAQQQVKAAAAQRDAAQQQATSARAALAQSVAALQQAEVNRRTIAIRRYDVTQSRATLEQAQAGVKVAEASQSLVTERRRELQAAQDGAAQAEAALRLAQTNVDNTVLKAPFDCTVLSKDVEIGDLVAVGSPVVTIADLVHPYLRVFVSEADVAHVKLGQTADVEVDGFPNREFKGVVDEIRNRAEYTPTNVQTKDERAKLVFGVRLSLENKDGVLKPGLPADAVIMAP